MTIRAEFRNGAVIEGGKVLGNIKNGVVRQGSSSYGDVLGTVKNGIEIREGKSSYGSVIATVKDGVIKRGYSSIGKVKNGVVQVGGQEFIIKGMEREYDADIVAACHFLLKKCL